MIELTDQQVQALENPEATPPRARESADQGDVRLTPR